MRSEANRNRTYRRGIWAENLAILFLRLKGYRIRGHRFKCPVGEIDIIAESRRWIVFVEVKVRPTLAQAAEAVTGRQQRRINRAAEWYLAHRVGVRERREAASCRFDAILMAPWRWPVHVKNAWQMEQDMV